MINIITEYYSMWCIIFFGLKGSESPHYNSCYSPDIDKELMRWVVLDELLCVLLLSLVEVDCCIAWWLRLCRTLIGNMCALALAFSSVHTVGRDSLTTDLACWRSCDTVIPASRTHWVGILAGWLMTDIAENLFQRVCIWYCNMWQVTLWII